MVPSPMIAATIPPGQITFLLAILTGFSCGFYQRGLKCGIAVAVQMPFLSWAPVAFEVIYDFSINISSSTFTLLHVRHPSSL